VSKATARRLVVDCSVMRATGGPESKHPTGVGCRSFLEGIREHGHRLVITDAIVAEWNKYRRLRKFSAFAIRWQTEMSIKKRVDRLDVGPDKGLRDEIAEAAADPNVAVLMDEDAHLIEAALASDRLVASLDKVRAHFGKIVPAIPRLGVVVWVDPSRQEEVCVDWLRQGAKSEASRMLKNYVQNKQSKG